jgi:hypothetical protein
MAISRCREKKSKECDIQKKQKRGDMKNLPLQEKCSIHNVLCGI